MLKKKNFYYGLIIGLIIGAALGAIIYGLAVTPEDHQWFYEQF